jgi:hypothetical protein
MRKKGQRYHPSRIEAAASPPRPPEPAEDTAWPTCTACGTNPLVTDEDVARGVCTPCQQASTHQPNTEAPERNGHEQPGSPAADRAVRPAHRERNPAAATLKHLRVHEREGMLPTSGRFLFYELEHDGAVSKKAVRQDGTPMVRRADRASPTR